MSSIISGLGAGGSTLAGTALAGAGVGMVIGMTELRKHATSLGGVGLVAGGILGGTVGLFTGAAVGGTVGAMKDGKRSLVIPGAIAGAAGGAAGMFALGARDAAGLPALALVAAVTGAIGAGVGALFD